MDQPPRLPVSAPCSAIEFTPIDMRFLYHVRPHAAQALRPCALDMPRSILGNRPRQHAALCWTISWTRSQRCRPKTSRWLGAQAGTAPTSSPASKAAASGGFTPSIRATTRSWAASAMLPWPIFRRVDCIVVATAADTACDVLEQPTPTAWCRDHPGGGLRKRQPRARRERPAAARARGKGMCICGPNCMGPSALRPPPWRSTTSRSRCVILALVSPERRPRITAFNPLMTDREPASPISSLRQSTAPVETSLKSSCRIARHRNRDRALQNPRKLKALARAAVRSSNHCAVPVRQSAAGRLTLPHPALATDSALPPPIWRCGIMQVETFDRFVETIELSPMRRSTSNRRQVVVISGSGGGAANAADRLAPTRRWLL